MGTYRIMTRLWPQPRNPEIIVTGGFPEFYVTAFDLLGSRTIFLYCEVIKGELTLFLFRFIHSWLEMLRQFFR